MKSFLVIGLGQFGQSLAKGLVEHNNQVMIVDSVEATLEDLLPIVDAGRVADCSNEKVIESLGVQEYDTCFVCIGDKYFQEALEITALLKEHGAKYVISMANQALHERLLKHVGADEVIFPDRDIAERSAVKYSSKSIFDYFELEEGYSIYEMSPVPHWVDKTLSEANIRAKYNVNIIAVRSHGAALNMNPGPKYKINEDDKLLVLGHKDDLAKLEKRLKE